MNLDEINKWACIRFKIIKILIWNNNGEGDGETN